jgi:signal transduction histidine kinase
VRITVSDNGAGIDPAFLPHVFERFRQADTTALRSQGGLGLGLSIVRHLVELHGGSVTVTSEGHGKGTQVVIVLPTRPAGEQDAASRAPDAQPHAAGSSG